MTEQLNEVKDANRFLKTEPIGKLLIKFSVPCVMSMLVSALYNIVDQIFIGQGVGYLGNAATTVVYPFTVIALALSLLVGDGCASLLSLSLGKGDHEAAHKSVGNCFMLLIVISVVLTALGFIFKEAILSAFGVTEACHGYAVEYMDVILIGIPFFMITSGLNGTIRADGSPAFAMVSTLIGAVLNLILDPVAIFGLNMGVRGAAIATIIGQIVTCVISVVYFRKTKAFKLTKKSFVPNGGILRKMCGLGISSFIIQMAIVVVMAVTNNLISVYGPSSEYGADIPLSAIGIVMKVFAIVIAFAVGIAVGGQPIVGYNYGAGDYKRVFKCYKMMLIANLIVGGISMLIFELFPGAIVSIFGSESELYNQYADMCFRIFLGGIMLTCVQKCSSIFLQSIGKPVKSTILSLSRDIVFFIPTLFILAPISGVTSMLWAAPIADVLALILTVILISCEYRSLKKPQK